MVKNSLKNGFGLFFWNFGAIFEGEWENDERKKGKQYWPDGKFYEGEFKNAKIHGKGKMTYPDGTEEEGLWENDQFKG